MSCSPPIPSAPGCCRGRPTRDHRIGGIQTRLADIGAHAAPARAAGILAGLGFSTPTSSAPARSFPAARACGWRSRGAFSDRSAAARRADQLSRSRGDTLARRAHRALSAYRHHCQPRPRPARSRWIGSSISRAPSSRSTPRLHAFERPRRERQELDAHPAKKQEAQRERLQAFVDQFRAKATKAHRRGPDEASGEARPDRRDRQRRSAADHVSAPAKLLSPPIIAVDGVSRGLEPDVQCCAGCRRGSTTTTASPCLAPTATANGPW